MSDFQATVLWQNSFLSLPGWKHLPYATHPATTKLNKGSTERDENLALANSPSELAKARFLSLSIHSLPRCQGVPADPYSPLLWISTHDPH